MFYRQSIVVFGFVLPAAICAVVVGGGIALKAKAAASFQEKQALYKSSEANRAGSQSIEATINKKREHVERWKTQMEKETSNAITSQLKEIGDKLPPKEFQQTAFERPNSGGATGSAQSSSQVRLAFRATYRSMQKAFIELETRMPQLQLQELKIEPSPSSTSTMNFQVTYTAWEK